MLNTIRTYIDGLFAELPDSPDVNRAHADLVRMSEDKYHELRDEGLTDNEATGRVITEFGNLDDLADDLGIRTQLDLAATEPRVPTLTKAEVDEHVAAARSSGVLIGCGVYLILIGLSGTVLLNATGAEQLAGIPILVAVAIAVGMFILGGRRMHGVTKMRHREVRVDPAVAEEARVRRRRGEGAYTASLVVGVGLIILSAAIPAILTAVGGDSAESYGAIGLFLVAGIGIAVLVSSSIRRSALHAVEAAGAAPTRAERAEEEQSSIIGRIASVYWPLVVLGFLAWSFIGNAWSISWIVFPLAGVGFAAVVGITSLVRPQGSGDRGMRRS